MSKKREHAVNISGRKLRRYIDSIRNTMNLSREQVKRAADAGSKRGARKVLGLSEPRQYDHPKPT